MSESPAKTSPVEPVPPPIEPAPMLVKIEVDSTPRGAFVALNGDKKGKTPLAVELEKGSEATVRFSLRGYRSEKRRLVAEQDTKLVVRLKKKTPRKKSPRQPPPIKTDF